MSVQAEHRYQRSHILFDQAQKVLPGGVNSPVRAFKSVKGSPIFIEKAKESRLWDADGNEFIDYVGSWGTAILGHAPAAIVESVMAASKKGLSFGTPTAIETLLAEKIAEIVPSIEMVRMVSSGTEACMSALRLARAFTQRPKIVKFSGCYHGHSDMLLVEAGSGVATLGIPGSPGVPEEATRNTLIANFNDEEALGKIFSQHGSEIAAVIIEPFVGNAGFIRPKAKFLSMLRELCDTHQAILIFDEVMTGFRVALAGAQSLVDIKPDLTTFGKIIGAGLPVGAYGGRRDIMSHIAPQGPVYQAGTLSGNPVAMAAGLESLKILQSKDYSQLSSLTQMLTKGIIEEATKQKIPLVGDAEGGMFGLFFSSKSVTDYREAKLCNQERFNRFFWHMLDEGIYWAPSAFEAGFVSFAHSEKDIHLTIEKAGKAFQQMAASV